MVICCLGFLVLMFAGSAYAFKELAPVMVPKAASIHGAQTDFLFNITMIIIRDCICYYAGGLVLFCLSL